jgi:hypothetical protein
MEIDRRAFLASIGGVAVLQTLDPEAKAEALEHYMMDVLDGHVHDGEAQVLPAPPEATIRRGAGSIFGPRGQGEERRMPGLAEMPERPTLEDFFRLRFAPATHVLQSAKRALDTGMSEEIVLACLLHDVVLNLVRVDHGWWGAQMLEPYVSEKVSWAIRYHQALRFYPDSSVGYEYPELYNRIFGEDYVPQRHIKSAYEYARNHRWYMEARLITVNDLYAFQPGVQPAYEEFTDIVGRHFRQPKEGLGFDGSPTAHMWRTLIYPDNPL